MIKVTVKKVAVYRSDTYASFDAFTKPCPNGVAWEVTRHSACDLPGSYDATWDAKYFGSKAPAQVAAGIVRKGGPMYSGAWGRTINGVVVL